MSKNWSPAPEGSSHTCKELNTVEGVQWRATEMTKRLDHLTLWGEGDRSVIIQHGQKGQSEILSINSRHFKKYFGHCHWDFNILVQVSWTTQEKWAPFPLHRAPRVMLLPPGKLSLAQLYWLQKGLGNRANTTCQAKINVGSEKLQMKILPYSPEISCSVSVYLHIYPNSCNRMFKKLSLRKDVQAQSQYLSMEAFVPSSWAGIKRQQKQYIFCELQNACGESMSELGKSS